MLPCVDFPAGMYRAELEVGVYSVPLQEKCACGISFSVGDDGVECMHAGAALRGIQNADHAYVFYNNWSVMFEVPDALCKVCSSRATKVL